MTADSDKLATIPGQYATPAVTNKLPRYTGPKDGARNKEHCDVCGGYHAFPSIHLDYQGHADLTLDLLAVDPLWSWRPAAMDPDGTPVVTVRNGVMVMWGYVTICGHERLGVGTCSATKEEAEKELIGDLLRNVALRFGFATKLWSKETHVDDDDGPGQPRKQGSPRKQQAAKRTSGGNGASGPASSSQLKIIDNRLDKLGVPATDLDRDAVVTRLTGKARAQLDTATAITLMGVLQKAQEDGSGVRVKADSVELTGPLADALSDAGAPR